MHVCACVCVRIDDNEFAGVECKEGERCELRFQKEIKVVVATKSWSWNVNDHRSHCIALDEMILYKCIAI